MSENATGLGVGWLERERPGLGDYKYDLAVAYRIYPKVSKPAQSLPFGDDKLQQAEICLRSFRNSLGSLRVKLWAILDGCPQQYHALFGRYFAEGDLVFVELEGVGNRATYARQLDILLSQDDAEFVYLAEDDYVYLAAQFPRMLEFLRNGQSVDFVSSYDHPDCYSLDLHREPKWVTVFKQRHWRTASSTCLTFLTRKATLARHERVFRTYASRNDDCAMWLSLTKKRVFNPLAVAQYFARRDFYRYAPVKAWLFCWKQILFGRAMKLWVPVPGVATHLSAGSLSPCVDWLALMKEMAPQAEVTRALGVAQAPGRVVAL